MHPCARRTPMAAVSDLEAGSNMVTLSGGPAWTSTWQARKVLASTSRCMNHEPATMQFLGPTAPLASKVRLLQAIHPTARREAALPE